MIDVVVADDQDLIRAGLRVIIDTEPDMRVVGEARDGAEAARVARETAAHIVLMDVQMPGTDGLAGVIAVAAARPSTRVIMLTMYDVDDYVYRSLKAGASGFLLKTTPPEELTSAIREVNDGRRMFAPSVTERLIEAFTARPAPVLGVPEQLAALTERELEVFSALSRGLSNAEIGVQLSLTEATVKTYVTRILAKLGLRDRVQAVILAYECGAIG